MEKARDFLGKVAAGDETDRVSRLTFPAHQPHLNPSFYEYFVLRGIHLDRVEPGSLSCSFKVPPRLTDRDGKLTMGAIATLVDEIGAAVIHQEGNPMDVSVDMSISYMSDANINVSPSFARFQLFQIVSSVESLECSIARPSPR
ncbi:hypothetical protein ACS0TY_007980 [Phlomoides rotata]